MGGERTRPYDRPESRIANSGLRQRKRSGRRYAMVLAALLALAAQGVPREPLPAWCTELNMIGNGRTVPRNPGDVARLKDPRTPLDVAAFVDDPRVAGLTHPVGAPLSERARLAASAPEKLGRRTRYTLPLARNVTLAWLVDPSFTPSFTIETAIHHRVVTPAQARDAFAAARRFVIARLGPPTHSAYNGHDRIFFSGWRWSEEREVVVLYRPPYKGTATAELSVSVTDALPVTVPQTPLPPSRKPSRKLPGWSDRVDSDEDGRPVEDRSALAAPVLRGPKAVGFAELLGELSPELLADLPGFALLTAPVGGVLPDRFRRGGIKEDHPERNEVDYVIFNSTNLWSWQYTLDRESRIREVACSGFVATGRSERVHERLLASLRERLGIPTSVERNEGAASLSMRWAWRDRSTLFFSFSTATADEDFFYISVKAAPDLG